MKLSTLRYAQRNLDIVAEENGFITDIVNGKLYIQFPSGYWLNLSDTEIEYQAIEYLQREISFAKDWQNN
jgi:hypothetical protein